MVESSCSMNSAMATTHGKKRLTVGLSIRGVLPKSVAQRTAGRFIAKSIIAKSGVAYGALPLPAGCTAGRGS